MQQQSQRCDTVYGCMCFVAMQLANAHVHQGTCTVCVRKHSERLPATEMNAAYECRFLHKPQTCEHRAPKASIAMLRNH
jgi:hypothetical protein